MTPDTQTPLLFAALAGNVRADRNANRAAVSTMVREHLAAKGIRPGMVAASDHADRETPGWTQIATAFLLAYAGCHERFIAEDVLKAAWDDPTFPQPPDHRSWGSVFNAASRRGEIVKVGFKARNQGNPCVQWAKGGTT